MSLEHVNGGVTETMEGGMYPTGTAYPTSTGYVSRTGLQLTSTTAWPPYQTIYYNSWPVYVCTDKTKKAIEVLKALQAEKMLECKSVPRFIELVEKIAGLL